jgi:hypothetical protein
MLFALIKNIVEKKFENNQNIFKHSPGIPLNLHQGSVVTLPDLDIALAQADGSIIPNVIGKQTIAAVGIMELFGFIVYNSYLQDGTSFLRTIVDKQGNVKEVALFTNKDEITPQTKEDWEFWLGSYQKDATGQFVRDSAGYPILAEAGLIGWNQFQIDGPPTIVYDRSWMQSQTGIEPISYTESITNNTGQIIILKHEGMEYSRIIGQEPTTIIEDLLVHMSQFNDEASINIYIGIPLNITDIKVLATS